MKRKVFICALSSIYNKAFSRHVVFLYTNTCIHILVCNIYVKMKLENIPFYIYDTRKLFISKSAFIYHLYSFYQDYEMQNFTYLDRCILISLLSAKI